MKKNYIAPSVQEEMIIFEQYVCAGSIDDSLDDIPTSDPSDVRGKDEWGVSEDWEW